MRSNLPTLTASLRWGLALLWLLSGCGQADSRLPATRQPLYFDLKSVLDQQVRQLTQRHAPATKQVRMRDDAAETVRVPTVKWADELQIFYQADINKPALRGAYKVDSAAGPDGRPYRVYTRLPGQENAPVAQLAVLGTAGQEQKITALIDQHNPLFTTRKNLLLVVRQGRLTDYEVTGTQKLVLFDSLRYAAAGHVE